MYPNFVRSLHGATPLYVEFCAVGCRLHPLPPHRRWDLLCHRAALRGRASAGAGSGSAGLPEQQHLRVRRAPGGASGSRTGGQQLWSVRAG